MVTNVPHIHNSFYTIENHLAKIMSAKRAFAVNSGMTALDVITRLVKAGEEVIAGNDLYGGKNPFLHLLLLSTTLISLSASPLLLQLAHRSNQKPTPTTANATTHPQASRTRQVQA